MSLYIMTIWQKFNHIQLETMYKVNSNEQAIGEEDGLNKYSHPLQPQQQCFFQLDFSLFMLQVWQVLTSFCLFMEELKNK